MSNQKTKQGLRACVVEEKEMAKEAAIELFRENMSDMGQVGPVSLFLENSASLVDPALGSNPDVVNDYARIQASRLAAKAQEIHDGTLSGSVDGVRGGIAERVADNRDSKEAKAARDQKQADDTLFYLTLMQSGDFDAYIAETIVSGMNDQEISDLVSMIEDETGTSFEQYAEDVLGDDVPQRYPHESDLDFQRRVLTAIAEEVLDNGEIKPEYANDPVAKFIRDHEFRAEAVATVRSDDQLVADGADVSSVVADASARMNSGMEVTLSYTQNSQTDELVATGNRSHDGFSDTDFATTEAQAESASFLNSFPSGALETASVDFGNQFAAAASASEGDKPRNQAVVTFDVQPT